MALRIRLRPFAACAGALAVIAVAGAAAPIQAQASISGMVTYRERMALPSDAVIEASLEDVSNADAPATVIGKTRIETPSQVPIHFTIDYDPSKVDTRHLYSIRSRIMRGNQILFTATNGFPVLGTTKLTTADLLLNRIANSPAPLVPASPPAATLENTNWKLVKLGNQELLTDMPPRNVHFLLQSGQKRVTGSGGCNPFTGDYAIAREKLSFDKVAATMMACIEGKDIEQTFFKVLYDTATWRIRGQSLELFDSAGKSLAQFESATPK